LERYFVPKRSVLQKKEKGSVGLGAFFCLKNGSGYKSQGGPKYLQGGKLPPYFPHLCLEFKSYTAVQTLRHYFNINTSTVAVMPWRYDAELGTANLLHASAKHGEYNEGFGFWFV